MDAAPGPPGDREPGKPPVIICHCFRITDAMMRRMVAERGLTTVDEVSDLTGACRGCQTCRPEIEAILREAREE